MPNERLEVHNRTTYDTRDIRSAVLACEKYLDLKGRRLVKVVYSRKRSVSGYAYYPSAWNQNEGFTVKLRVPKIRKGEVVTDQLICDFLWLVEHELSHSKGVRHGIMRGSPCGQVHGLGRRPNWGGDLTLRLKPAKAKPTKDTILTKRAAKVQTDLARWNRKLKLAKTKVRKLERQAAYYEMRVRLAPTSQPSDFPPMAMAAFAAKTSPTES